MESLLEAFGPNLGAGYDVGCKFGTTLGNSSLGPSAKEKNHRCLVGAFHGHAHNRLCQLSYLATYVKGLGLEDLETCERFFSKSNALASSTRYASIFHRAQAIAGYMQHNDNFEVYPNLSKFIVGNYKQALDLLKGGPALESMMEDLGITDASVFNVWLEEEREYLQGLAKEPVVETMQMEYYQKLVDLGAHE